MLESIEKLRELAADINSTEIIDHLDVVGKFMFHSEWLDSWHKAFDSACDEIEREIAERYMAHGIWNIKIGAASWASQGLLSHVKPRTVEDVLQEFASRVLTSGHQWDLDAQDTIAEYAAELRMAGDGDD